MPGCEGLQGERWHFQAGQRRTLMWGKEGLVCLDVSRYRGIGAFPGGPKAHLEEAQDALAQVLVARFQEDGRRLNHVEARLYG